jgi:non-ribosomal peptide synthetase component E (peptide arylation enzyme)
MPVAATASKAVAATVSPSSTMMPVSFLSCSEASNTTHRMMSTSAGSTLKALAAENPYKDVVRYEFKNRKWSLQHVDFYSEALACGLLENGLQPGDVVLSWLPVHFSESVCSLHHVTNVSATCVEKTHKRAAVTDWLTVNNVALSRITSDLIWL